MSNHEEHFDDPWQTYCKQQPFPKPSLRHPILRIGCQLPDRCRAPLASSLKSPHRAPAPRGRRGRRCRRPRLTRRVLCGGRLGRLRRRRHRPLRGLPRGPRGRRVQAEAIAEGSGHQRFRHFQVFHPSPAAAGALRHRRAWDGWTGPTLRDKIDSIERQPSAHVIPGLPHFHQLHLRGIKSVQV